MVNAPYRPAISDGAPTRLLDPDLVLKTTRLQSMPASRFSAGRTLLEKMQREGWSIERVSFDVDAESRGEALYRVRATGDWVFDFVVHSYTPQATGRSGRITEPNWDMMAALIEGPTTTEDRAVTRAELPKLYAGRAVPGTLTWARSNRSFRAFDQVAEALASGTQPDVEALWEIGYLMRNTGLDGNGTFLTRSFLTLEDDHPLRFPLHAQLLSAFLLREFSADLVDAAAAHRDPGAARLSPELRRMIGIGNGSALGLFYFVNTHPYLFDSWLEQRQNLIARGSVIPLVPGSNETEEYRDLIRRAAEFLRADPYLYNRFENPHDVAPHLDRAADALDELLQRGTTSGAELLGRLDGSISPEAWEMLAALLIEFVPYEEIERALEAGIRAEVFASEPLMPISELAEIIRRDYRWALEFDMDAPDARSYVWYKSQNAEEPRRGPASEVHEGRNWALDLPGDVQQVQSAIEANGTLDLVGELLREEPQLRAAVERIQSLKELRFHSPHMNMLGGELVPVSLVRFMNAAIHGLLRTVDEGDDRNVLGLIYLGAPTAADLNAGRRLDTRFPLIPTTK